MSIVSVSSLRHALSVERLQAYVRKGDTGERDALCRYSWNLALCAAIHPALHFLEVTLRNHLFEHSRTIIDESSLDFVAVPCWLDAHPTLLGEQEAKKVLTAKMEIQKSKKKFTPGQLISTLGFGFWVSLCKRPYEQGRSSGPALWPAIARVAFPYLQKRLRTRQNIHDRLDEIRKLRNRVGHHEPIWESDLCKAEDRAIEALGWMNANLAKAVRAESTLTEVVANGHRKYQPIVERVVKL